MDESFGDRESVVVARVAEIFTEVQVDTIFGLIRRVTKFHSEEDTVDSAVEKISNFLLENNNNYLPFDNEFIMPRGSPGPRVLVNEAKFVALNAPAPIINEVIELDDSVDNDEDNLMALARQLAGNFEPVVEKIVEKVGENDAEDNLFQWMNGEEVHHEETVINEPPVALADENDVKINEPEVKKVTFAKPKVPKLPSAKRRKKDKPLEVIQEGIVAPNITEMKEVTEPREEVEPTVVPQPKDQPKDAEMSSVEESQPEQSPVGDLNIVSSVPDMDCTVADIDVMFECMCCYNDVPFDYMVQCSEGHLFCCQCLERYAQESVYGHGKGDLKCMTNECVASFPRSQLQRALPANLYKKYEERISDECLNSAAIENFIRCKFCNYGAELDPAQNFFKCPQCAKHFCRKCQEEFKDHEGLTCEQVEKDDETKIRTNYEEKMAEAKIRTCTKCKSRFTKDSGCNKITCRCGETMCYICRTPKINYNHFCQHPRTPTKECNKCKSCFLWSNADEDDKLAIEEIRKEGLKAREKEGFVGDKAIGAPKDPEVPGRAAAHNHLDEVINHVALQARIEVERAARIQAQFLARAPRPVRPKRPRGRRVRPEAAAARPIPLNAVQDIPLPPANPQQPIIPLPPANQLPPPIPNLMEPQDGLVANLQRHYYQRRPAAERRADLLMPQEARAMMLRNAAVREEHLADERNRAYRHRHMHQQHYYHMIGAGGDPRLDPTIGAVRMAQARNELRVFNYAPNNRDGVNANAAQHNGAAEVNAANVVATVGGNGETFTITKETKGRLLNMIGGTQTALDTGDMKRAKEMIKNIKTMVEDMK